ncbi:hypothetical protein PoMZ_10289, partial [Pyricularia oryzae]
FKTELRGYGARPQRSRLQPEANGWKPRLAQKSNKAVVHPAVSRHKHQGTDEDLQPLSWQIVAPCLFVFPQAPPIV